MARVCCNFERALIHLREGKKVARESWLKGDYLYLNEGVLYFENNELSVMKRGICSVDILAEDWYIL